MQTLPTFSVLRENLIAGATKKHNTILYTYLRLGKSVLQSIINCNNTKSKAKINSKEKNESTKHIKIYKCNCNIIRA